MFVSIDCSFWNCEKVSVSGGNFQPGSRLFLLDCFSISLEPHPDSRFTKRKPPRNPMSVMSGMVVSRKDRARPCVDPSLFRSLPLLPLCFSGVLSPVSASKTGLAVASLGASGASSGCLFNWSDEDCVGCLVVLRNCLSAASLLVRKGVTILGMGGGTAAEMMGSGLLLETSSYSTSGRPLSG